MDGRTSFASMIGGVGTLLRSRYLAHAAVAAAALAVVAWPAEAAASSGVEVATGARFLQVVAFALAGSHLCVVGHRRSPGSARWMPGVAASTTGALVVWSTLLAIPSAFLLFAAAATYAAEPILGAVAFAGVLGAFLWATLPLLLVVPVAALDEEGLLAILKRALALARGARGALFGALLLFSVLPFVLLRIVSRWLPEAAATAVGAIVGGVGSALMITAALAVYLQRVAPPEGAAAIATAPAYPDWRGAESTLAKAPLEGRPEVASREALIAIEDLHLHFETYGGTVKALRGVDLHIDKGETLGLVGESGCGKSQTALALLRLVAVPPGKFVKGTIRYHRPRADDRSRRDWVDVLKLSEREMRRIRGNDISMIFQEPMTSLNPVLPVGEQITEAIITHQDVGVRLTRLDRWMMRRGFTTRRFQKAHRAAVPRAVEMLRSIGIADAESVMRRYPHELSGGMRQRVMIAIALSCDPDMLVADEPTTALDVTIQAQIMDLMRSLKKRTNAAILLITHHLGLVAEMADRIAVMYAGRIAEVGPATDVFKAPKHPYTLGLLNSIPDIKGQNSHEDLPVIPGSVPDLSDPPAGCPFHPRCPFAFDRCREKVPALQPAQRQLVACHLYDRDVELPRALREKDASVYRRGPGADAFAPNPRVTETDAPRGAVPE